MEGDFEIQSRSSTLERDCFCARYTVKDLILSRDDPDQKTNFAMFVALGYIPECLALCLIA